MLVSMVPTANIAGHGVALMAVSAGICFLAVVYSMAKSMSANTSNGGVASMGFTAKVSLGYCYVDDC